MQLRAYISSIILVACLLVLPAAAQKRDRQTRNAPAQGTDSAQRQQFRARGPGPHAGEWLRKNRDVPANEQLHALESDPNYKSLPTERQQQLRDRLQQFNSLPPQQRDRILQRMETWEHLSSNQRQQARSVFDQMRTIPDERRGMVRRAYRDLQSMPPEERQKVLNSDKYRNAFNDNERDVIKRSLDLNLNSEEAAAASK